MAAVLAVLTLALAACGGGEKGALPPLNVTIHGKDISFDTQALNAKAGQVVNVTYVNDGALDHTFLIDGVITEQKVAPGATINFAFTAPAAGAYTYYCNVAGHTEAGMTGTLTVTGIAASCQTQKRLSVLSGQVLFDSSGSANPCLILLRYHSSQPPKSDETKDAS